MESRNIIVTPGDLLGSKDDNYMGGSGTYEEDGCIYSAVAGIQVKIDRLLMVKPLKRKQGSVGVGDIVVGRIVSVEHNRWKVDINSYQHANLLLTAINLPGGEQRRRSDDDKSIMREYFKENDIISAEVQLMNSHDNSILLQTRNMKYGKLVNGFLLKVDHNLIRRMKNHYLNLSEENVSVILGNNGYIWIYYNPASSKSENDMLESLMLGEQHVLNLQQAVEIPRSVKIGMAKIRNWIVILDSLKLPIFEYSISKALEIVSSVETPFQILTDDSIIGKIQDAIKEYIEENFMKSFSFQ